MKSSFVAISLALTLPAAVPAVAQWHSVMRDHSPMVTGSGRVISQQRTVGDFHRIEMKGASNVTVRLGGAPSLTITADDNLLPQLSSQVSNGMLVLDSRGSYRTKVTPRYAITVPNLDYLRSQGSGNVVLSGVSNRDLELLIQGSGDIKATGRTERLQVAVQGSGNADMRGLAAGSADVSVMGSGNAWVDTNGAVNAKSFGSGNVYVGGRPSSLNTQRAGSGQIIVSRP